MYNTVHTKFYVYYELNKTMQILYYNIQLTKPFTLGLVCGTGTRTSFNNKLQCIFISVPQINRKPTTEQILYRRVRNALSVVIYNNCIQVPTMELDISFFEPHKLTTQNVLNGRVIFDFDFSRHRVFTDDIGIGMTVVVVVVSSVQCQEWSGVVSVSVPIYSTLPPYTAQKPAIVLHECFYCRLGTF